jgi:cytidylate kinase
MSAEVCASMGLIITISGRPGSGKSTLGRLLSAKLNIPFFSMGEIRRHYAVEHGMTINDLNERAEKDPSSDHQVDEFQRRLPEKHPSFIVDSRLGYHFLPQSVKIFIKVPREIAAKRIFERRRESEAWASVEDGIEALKQREESDKHRYKHLYNIEHPPSMEHYDLVLDSTTTEADQLLKHTMDFLEQRKLID